MKTNIDNTGLSRLLGLLLSALLLGYSCNKDNNPSTTALTVRYEIRGTDCFVYCTGSNGQANNFFHQNSSFTYSYNAQPGDTLRLIAQNTSGNPESISGYIYLNNTLLTADTAYCPINGTIILSDTLN